jgi:hypothetical protein
MMTPSGSEPELQDVRRIFGFALLLGGLLFFLHTTILFDFAAGILESNVWLIDHLGPHRAGKVIIFACFSLLFAVHVAEAAIWGLYLWWQGLTRTFMDGVYFAVGTVTTLGTGDVALAPPWRMLGPLIAITALLKFGCSTAFLFVVIQGVWTRHL